MASPREAARNEEENDRVKRDLGRKISRTCHVMGVREEGREGVRGRQTTVMGTLREEAWDGEGAIKNLQSQNLHLLIYR